MRSLVVAAAAAALVTGTNASVAGPAYNWQGFYVGAHAGYGGADFSGIFDSGELPGSPEFVVRGSQLDVEDWLGGFQAGYNFVSGSWLIGIEGDVSFADWNDTAFDPDPGRNTDNITASIDTLGTIRGRLGYIAGPLLVYATAGIAFADAEWTACDCEPPTHDRGKLSFDETGYVVGGGLEWAIDSNWSLKGEGLYMDFDERRDASGLNGDADPGDFARFEDVWVARVGINYRFGDSREPAYGLK